jgi:hypothetical protein
MERGKRKSWKRKHSEVGGEWKSKQGEKRNWRKRKD